MNETIFYNGFNLLVDILIGLGVWFFTYRHAWLVGYGQGAQDEREDMDKFMAEAAGDHWYETQREDSFFDQEA
jgi:hypothetical protein